jgi:GNAT superfamily N-acetyltransferase
MAPRTVLELSPAEAERAHAIVTAAGVALRERLGLDYWDPPYPLARMRDEAATRQLLLVLDAGAPVATFTVGPTPLQPYTVFDPAVPALYLNRLAVVPARWGEGLGRFCMADVEARARAAGAHAVRFDAVAANAALLQFYRRLGYVERGPHRIGALAVTCFERVLP